MSEPKLDIYQERYLSHQRRKKEVLAELVYERHSERRFADGPVAPDDLVALLDVVRLAPSSCDRKGLRALVIDDRDTLALLGGLLVGGVGWIHRAPAVFLLLADRAAYKAGDEIKYMPYLDAGVVAGQLALAAEALGLKGCFVNPNVREQHRPLFRVRFGDEIPCGAFAVGRPHPDDTP
jgi:nitroreductase